VDLLEITILMEEQYFIITIIMRMITDIIIDVGLRSMATDIVSKEIMADMRQSMDSK
jgi:hypothetical protein